ncbi:MAG: type II toxin-antitoxin system HicB family antitoxin [Bryobacterales bacterium]|nr:type II toxin-antitoxin system HicB family antitoxin [Bryobacterales bacterium]
MRSYTAVIERCAATGYYVGDVPGFPGAHRQGEDLADLSEHLRKVISMLLEAGESERQTEFIGAQETVVA